MMFSFSLLCCVGIVFLLQEKAGVRERSSLIEFTPLFQVELEHLKNSSDEL